MTVRARLIPLDSKRADDNRRAGSLTIYFSQCTHDVAAAYCLAMAEVRVRLPLGAISSTDVSRFPVLRGT